MEQEDINRLRELAHNLREPDWHDPQCPFARHCYCGTDESPHPHDRVRHPLALPAADGIETLIAQAERVKVLEEALQDAVKTSTENARQRDLFKHHLTRTASALEGELDDFTSCDEEQILSWVGEDMGRRIIAAQIALRAARTALEQTGASHG